MGREGGTGIRHRNPTMGQYSEGTCDAGSMHPSGLSECNDKRLTPLKLYFAIQCIQRLNFNQTLIGSAQETQGQNSVNGATMPW